jgi:hypothetical protein
MGCTLLYLERAYSRFLIARLQLNHVLRARGKSFMRMRLKTLPINEIEAYNQIMEHINSMRDSKIITLRILSWVRSSKRPLRMEELREVIWVEEQDKQLNTENINGFSMNDVIWNCESLITCDKTTHRVRFSHTTVLEFFEKSDFAGDLMSHTALAKTCLTYLNFDVFGAPCSNKESLSERTETYIFSDYAAKYWAVHARNANTEDAIWSEVLIAIVDTFKQDGNRESAHQLRNHRSTPTGGSLLHVLVQSQLASYYMAPSLDKISNISYTYVFIIRLVAKSKLIGACTADKCGCDRPGRRDSAALCSGNRAVGSRQVAD